MKQIELKKQWKNSTKLRVGFFCRDKQNQQTFGQTKGKREKMQIKLEMKDKALQWMPQKLKGP